MKLDEKHDIEINHQKHDIEINFENIWNQW
jgi:hypothetical protein